MEHLPNQNPQFLGGLNEETALNLQLNQQTERKTVTVG